ncbi:MAG TPA: hypothetical protein VN886_05490 [Acidimicrobiales bacterium]|nr:hypothetical protein [Acidimicrobiales bacterium]
MIQLFAAKRCQEPCIKEALGQLEAQPGRDYESKMAERAAKEEALGHKLTGPKPTATPTRPRGVRKANITDPDSRIMATFNKRLQGYNAQAAASADQVIVAAEVHNVTNDQASFVPMAKAANENLAAAGHLGATECFVADAGYWSAANATTDVGADVLIATRKNAWRQAPKPSDDRLAVLARVNAGELSQRAAGDILGVSYTWVRDMTKRYFGTTGQRLTSTTDPDPAEWIPVIEALDRGEISRRAAADQLGTSAGRVNTMLAHVRGEAPEPSMVRRAMDDKLAQPIQAEPSSAAKSSSSPSSATSRPIAATGASPAGAWRPSRANGASSAPPTTCSSCERPSPADRRPRRARSRSEPSGFLRQPQERHIEDVDGWTSGVAISTELKTPGE